MEWTRNVWLVVSGSTEVAVWLTFRFSNVGVFALAFFGTTVASNFNGTRFEFKIVLVFGCGLFSLVIVGFKAPFICITSLQILEFYCLILVTLTVTVFLASSPNLADFSFLRGWRVVNGLRAGFLTGGAIQCP